MGSDTNERERERVRQTNKQREGEGRRKQKRESLERGDWGQRLEGEIGTERTQSLNGGG